MTVHRIHTSSHIQVNDLYILNSSWNEEGRTATEEHLKWHDKMYFQIVAVGIHFSRHFPRPAIRLSPVSSFIFPRPAVRLSPVSSAIFPRPPSNEKSVPEFFNDSFQKCDKSDNFYVGVREHARCGCRPITHTDMNYPTDDEGCVGMISIIQAISKLCRQQNRVCITEYDTWFRRRPRDNVKIVQT